MIWMNAFTFSQRLMTYCITNRKQNQICDDMNEIIPILTHWWPCNDAPIYQTFLYAFSATKILVFQLKFYWSLFLRLQLTISQHCFNKCLCAEQTTCHYLIKPMMTLFTDVYIPMCHQTLMSWYIETWTNMAACSRQHFQTLLKETASCCKIGYPS